MNRELMKEFNDLCDTITIWDDKAITGKIIINFKPEKIIFNKPATIVYWEDRTKTTVKCHNEDRFDPEKGLAMAILKKISGNTGSFNEVLKNWLDEAIYQGV